MESEKSTRGKKNNQKLKAYLVYEYLKKYTDEFHYCNSDDIVKYLNDRGIDAERRSIYRDINDINKLFYLLENEKAGIKEAEKALKDDIYDDYKTIVYDKSEKGFYVKRRLGFEEDVRLLAECVYAAKFIAKDTAEFLLNTICSLVSDYQAEDIRRDVYLADRVKTDNRQVFANVNNINYAIKNRENGVRKPCQIRFRYLTYNINNLKERAYRRGGSYYIVSPFQLIINEGNYYLLGYDERKNKMLTYRVDRMVNMTVLCEKRRTHEEEFKAVDLSTVFNMINGEKRTVQLRCINLLLDTMIERFGTKKARFTKEDDNHFIVTAEVEISNQFFGWILGFGKKVVLVAPDKAVQQFKDYVDKIRDLYE